MDSEKNRVSSHGETFDLNILKLKNLKGTAAVKELTSSQDAADSSPEEELEFVSIDTCLDESPDEPETLPVVDQKNRPNFKLTNSNSKKSSRLKTSEEVKIYLTPYIFEYAENLGKTLRSNGSAGSGITSMIKSFFSMKKREDHQLRRIETLLKMQEFEANQLAALKMKSATSEEMSQQELRVLTISKDVCFFIDVFGFDNDELKRILPEFLRPALNDSLVRVTNYTREKRILELHGNI